MGVITEPPENVLSSPPPTSTSSHIVGQPRTAEQLPPVQDDAELQNKIEIDMTVVRDDNKNASASNRTDERASNGIPCDSSKPASLQDNFVSQNEFDAWKNDLLIYLRSSKQYSLFLPNGLYATWVPFMEVRDGLRINELHSDDPLVRDCISRPSQEATDELILRRNVELTQFIQLICDLARRSGQVTVQDHCSSFDSCMELVYAMHNMETKPFSIFDMAEIKCLQSDDCNAFYVKFRSIACDHLRRKGEKVNFLKNAELLEDEILSPTFEDVIILWCLEKIDPSLPRQVKEAFGERMVGNVSLKDLQKEIFDNLPVMRKKQEVSETDKYLDIVPDIKQEGDVIVDLKNGDGELDVGENGNDDCEYFPEDEHDAEKVDSPDDFSDFNCQTCGKSFPTLQSLRSHEKCHKNKKLDSCVCEICDKSFSRRKWLIEHRKKMHKVELTCDVCSKTFSSRVKYNRHMKEHDVDFQYLSCDSSFTSKKKRDDHVLDENAEETTAHMNGESDNEEIAVKEEGQAEEKLNVDDLKDDKENKSAQFSCPKCFKSFSSKRKLQSHKKQEHRSQKNELFTCTICNKTYKTKKKLIQHRSRFHKVDHVCEVCEIVLPNKIKYFQHIKEHKKKGERVPSKLKDIEDEYDEETGVKEENCEDVGKRAGGGGLEKNYMCDICGRELSSLGSLIAHRKWHQRLENSNCDKCKLDFADRKAYLLHMRTHHRTKDQIEKKATCDKCGQTFNSKYNLVKHNKIHEGGKLRCNTCKRSFYDEKELKGHVCKHHACELCDMKFMRAKNLKMHERMHAGEVIYSCDLCEALFDRTRRLNEHRRGIHVRGRKYKCDDCPKSFMGKGELQKHKRIHTGEKPFKCNECGSAFTQRGNLMTHLKLHTNDLPFQCVGCQGKFRTTGDLKRHREVKMCGFTQDDLFTNKTVAANGETAAV